MDEKPKTEAENLGMLRIAIRAANGKLQPYIFGRDDEGRHTFGRISGVGVGWIGLIAAILSLNSATWGLATWIVAAFAIAHIGLLIIGQFSLSPAPRLVVGAIWLLAAMSGSIIGYSTTDGDARLASVSSLKKEDFRLKFLLFERIQGVPNWTVSVQWSSRVAAVWNELTELYFSADGEKFELSPYGMVDAIPVKGERFWSASSLFIKFKTWKGTEIGPFEYTLNFGEFAEKNSSGSLENSADDLASLLDSAKIEVTYEKAANGGSNSTWRTRIRFSNRVSNTMKGAHPEYSLDGSQFGAAPPLKSESTSSHDIEVTNAAGAKTFTLRYKTAKGKAIGPRAFDVDFSRIALSQLKTNILNGSTWVWCQRSYDRSATGGPPECHPHDLTNNAPAVKEILVGSNPEALTRKYPIEPDEESLNWAPWKGAKERGMTRISVPESWEKLYMQVRFFDNTLSALRSYKMP